MKKLIPILLIAFIFSGCALFRVHKMDIEQGNIITEKKIARLHPGMSELEVKEVMGIPVLINVFTPNRAEYVYTLQIGYNPMLEKRVTCIFRNDVLKEVIES